ncbi:unnamed protein product [Onchocerca flexuosa]|uniref:Nucleoprotein TPR/MPL1 domain-containing protein n=1 Tax=Onchocerca flexuosa TaxID=387005 RepID=A0A183I493_9BILA|nr:unnamed protein product [Onchocerca flexuosa]
MSDDQNSLGTKDQEKEKQQQQSERSGNIGMASGEGKSERQHESMFGKSLPGTSINISNLPDKNIFLEDTLSESVVLPTENVPEHVLFLTNEELDAVRDKLCRVSEAENALKKENEELLRDRSQRMAAMRELEAERDRILLAKNECEQKAEMLLRQREDYEGKINRLNHDKSLILSDLQLQKNEVAKLIEKNVSLDFKLDEYNKQKRVIEFEKERWAQEKEIYLHNKDWFMNEIKERDRKFAVLRIEMVRYTGELQAEIASITDKYESATNDIKKLTATVDDRNKEIRRLNDRVKEVILSKFYICSLY